MDEKERTVVAVEGMTKAIFRYPPPGSSVLRGLAVGPAEPACGFGGVRGRLQRAYERPTYAEAKRDLKAMRAELDELNQSAVASLDEGFEETLTLHRLGVFPLVGRSLKTTNVLESANAQAEQRCGRVDRWRNSNHKQRWLAAALIDIEPRLRRLLGYRHLPSLRAAIQKELGIIHPDSQTHAAA